MQQDAINLINQNTERQITLSCANDGRQTSLWQWIITDSTGQNKLLSSKTICRYGEGIWNTAPACPYAACKDDLCTVCNDDWLVSDSQIDESEQSDASEEVSEENETPFDETDEQVLDPEPVDIENKEEAEGNGDEDNEASGTDEVELQYNDS